MNALVMSQTGTAIEALGICLLLVSILLLLERLAK